MGKRSFSRVRNISIINWAKTKYLCTANTFSDQGYHFLSFSTFFWMKLEKKKLIK